jgi:uncharacterized protein YndB with AHSA1/START domain
MLKSMVAGAALALVLASAGHCEVIDPQANGFTLDQKIEIAAAPDKVYAALIDPSKWWAPRHTFSGDSKNMTLEARAGGCWCETLPNGGGVQHMTVIFVDPGKLLRMHGAIGPFQSTGMDGAMTITVDPVKKTGGTLVELSYSLGGYIWGGFGALPTTADGVLNQQVRRLKNYVETGSPEPK